MIEKISSRCSELFANGLGRFTGGPVSIRLREGARPIFMRARPVVYALRGPVERALVQLPSGSSIAGRVASAAAVAAVGLGIGAALYYFFKPEEENPHASSQRAADSTFNTSQFRERAWSVEPCSICMDAMTEADGELWMLPCGHRFHIKCVLPWTGEHSTCPNCRKAI